MSSPQWERRRTVWNTARAAPGHNPDAWRHDAFGNLIQFVACGNRQSAFGWEIAHIVPPERGGTDELDNLQPLHWRAIEHPRA